MQRRRPSSFFPALIHESRGDPDDETSGQVWALAAYGDTVAWSLGPRQKALVFTDTTQVAEVTTEKGALSWLDAGTDMIGFKNGSRPDLVVPNYLLYLRSGCLYNLGNAKNIGADVHVAGNHVMWATNSDNEDKPQLWNVATRR